MNLVSVLLFWCGSTALLFSRLPEAKSGGASTTESLLLASTENRKCQASLAVLRHRNVASVCLGRFFI